MAEETNDEEVTSTDGPKDGDEVNGMNMVDPVARADEDRTDKPSPAKEKPPKKTAKKKATRKQGKKPTIQNAFNRVKRVLKDTDYKVEIDEDHPRGAAVLVKREPDVRPVAYISSVNGEWNLPSLLLNIYGFLDQGTISEVRDPLVKDLNLRDTQITTFARY